VLCEIAQPTPRPVVHDTGAAPSSMLDVYQLGFGTVCGICTGVFLKKGLRAIAFLLGGVFVLLQVSPLDPTLPRQVHMELTKSTCLLNHSLMSIGRNSLQATTLLSEPRILRESLVTPQPREPETGSLISLLPTSNVRPFTSHCHWMKLI
jgi:hypothetical protein